jgi:hypothetical protein
MNMEKVGEWAFLLGIVVAVLAGLAGSAVAAWIGGISLLLVVLGIIVGLLNISEKETTSFLVAVAALIVASLGSFAVLDTVVAPLGTIIDAIVGNIAVFAAPAAVIVAVKAIAALAGKK